eukprot:3813576-Prorocentrum_lima.AAC.1
MTSSLVGSEMCIRDRVNSLQLAAATAHSRLDTVGRVARHLQIEPATVSYTHLTLPTICSV